MLVRWLRCWPAPTPSTNKGAFPLWHYVLPRINWRDERKEWGVRKTRNISAFLSSARGSLSLCMPDCLSALLVPPPLPLNSTNGGMPPSLHLAATSQPPQAISSPLSGGAFLSNCSHSRGNLREQKCVPPEISVPLLPNLPRLSRDWATPAKSGRGRGVVPFRLPFPFPLPPLLPPPPPRLQNLGEDQDSNLCSTETTGVEHNRPRKDLLLLFSFRRKGRRRRRFKGAGSVEPFSLVSSRSVLLSQPNHQH